MSILYSGSMKLSLHIYLSAILSLILVLGPTVGATGSVLCITADDHVRLESVCRPCCGTTVDAHSSAAVDHESHDECFNCTDISVSHLVLRQRFSPALTNAVTVGGLISPVFVQSDLRLRPPSGATDSLSLSTGFPLSPLSVLLATTVIRC